MSEENDDSQKTEDPTPRRIQEARKKGQVPLSREVNNWIMLLAGTLLVGTQSENLMGRLRDHLVGYLANAHAYMADRSGFKVVMTDSFQTVLGILLLPFLVLLVAAFFGPFAQIGPLFAPESIKPDISKLSPFKGFQRLFSKRAIMEFVKGMLKIGLVGAVGFVAIRPFYGQLDHFIGLPIPLLLDDVKIMVMRLLISMLVALLLIAVADLVYQRFEYYKKMRMTKQEIKDEYKQSEGDPHVKGRLRQLRAEKARQRMMQAVPQATVVITNPTHFAVALKYDPDTMDAPVCVAKGADEIALRIREIAKENDVVIYENPPLARVLYDTVELEDIIPAEHYQAVAEVISFVFKLKGRMK